MAQDDDRFEPRLGRSRPEKVRGPKTLRTELMHRVARAGGNPRRLPSNVPRASASAPAATGRFNARGRGAKIAATFPRDSGWSFDRHSGMRIRSRRVTVKVRIVKATGKAGGVKAHLRYLEREGVTREGEPGRLYSTFTDEVDRNAFTERGFGDRHQFRIILSPEDGAAYEDLKPFTREVMARMEEDLGTTLDWAAVDHHDTGHSHAHVVIRGVTEDGKILNIAGNYLSYGIRHRASEVLTRDLGPQTERDVQRQLESEVEAERLTRLDRTLIGRAEDGVVDMRMKDVGTEFDRNHHQLLIARARRLERMQLAKEEGPLRWSLSPNAEDVLRTMSERGDIIKTMHRAMTAAHLGRTQQLYVIHDREAAPVVGRIVTRGLTEEDGDRRYLIIDGIDGRTHYADIGETDGNLPIGSIVRVSNRSTEPRQVDRTVAEIAAAHDGRYSQDIHLRHDRTAHIEFADAHVRRLEAIRRGTGAVERERDGTWKIAPDHLDRVRDYEERLAKGRPLAIETLSSMPLERQIGAEGATWLDRELIGEQEHHLARYGFGQDVRQAMSDRRKWLIEHELARDDGEFIRYPRNLLETLQQREVRQAGARFEQQIGKEFVEPLPGQRVEGLVKQMVQLASGPFALIEKSLEFTLVPWRPMLERHIGREVSGTPHGDTYDWTLGRSRGLSL